ncbi:hypothetical protein [Streptodolium elevatio]|uniref:Uncharacterized protein n=1 Tax=Streptodolium elevatio TaxID=3157996 RepID=A0ABV3DL12_9ACTN
MTDNSFSTDAISDIERVSRNADGDTVGPGRHLGARDRAVN